jgi:hypothetical protein
MGESFTNYPLTITGRALKLSRDGKQKQPKQRQKEMSKKNFIQLANHIRTASVPFTKEHLELLADFCRSQNPRFMRERWLGYIRGECGSNGGAIKK